MKIPQYCLLLATLAVAQAQQSPKMPAQQSNPQVRTSKKVAAPSKSDDELFVWERPFYPVSNIPITRSATCSFKQGLSAAFQKLPSTKQNKGAPERVTYATSTENESDTISFTNLDTKSPTLQSNGGQASLVVLHDDGNQLILLNIQSPADGIELYTIFRRQGIVSYSQHKDSILIGPFAVLEMGYCH